LDIAVAV